MKKVSKNGQKLVKLTFLRVIAFCRKQFERNRYSKGANHNPFYVMTPKSQLCEGSFREKSKSLGKQSQNRENDNSEGHNFL